VIPYRDNLITGGRARASILLVLALALLNTPLFLVPAWRTDAVRALAFFPIRFSIQPLVYSYSLVTASLLHGDLFHLLGNCLFLVVFGRTLERLFGARLLLLLFPALGVAGFLLHWALYPASPAPVIGSSGAVAALMGAYLPLFPVARIRMIAFAGFFWKRFTLPAWAFLFYWIGLQVFSLAMSSQDGVAYAVHAGSFVAGMLGAIVWKTSYPFAEEKLAAFASTAFRDT